MLNGIDPIIIFHFSKTVRSLQDAGAKIPTPVSDSILSKLPLPAIPIYLSERISGLFIDSEDRNIDIETTVDGTVTDSVIKNQRPISDSLKISMVANANSVGLALFSALADLILPRITSKEYSITYLHGAITVFEGLLHSFAITQEAGTNRYNIQLEIQKPGKTDSVASTEVDKAAGIQLDPTKVPGK